MSRKAAIGSFLALVTGCGDAQQQREPAARRAASPPHEQQAVPVGNPRFEWFASQYRNTGGLSFAVAETDNVRVAMECERGSRSVRVSAVDPNAAGTQLVIGSGDASATLPATPSNDTMIDDSTYAAAITDVEHPVLQALENSGDLWVWTAEFPMRASSDDDRDAIAQFFAFCEGRLDEITPNWER
jgi:hypothetical protein